MGNHFQVSFLPWAQLNSEIHVGPVIFWPFNSNRNGKIKDQKISEHLVKYLNSYVDHSGNPVDTIIIASYKNINFPPLSKTEYSELRSAVDLLLFATIAPQVENAVCGNNRNMGPPSSEVFQLITQNFRPGDNDISVQSGSLLNCGLKIGKITFSKPWATGGNFGVPDENLLIGFNKVFGDKFPKDVRERIFRSLEWFRLSHVENDEISLLSKIVMMSTAFEIFLQFPRNDKRKYFAEYMEKNVAYKEFKRDNRITGKGKSVNLSLVECWAWDFYDLRSRIVHGDSITQRSLIYKDWITHLIVADLVFSECIKRVLYKYKCIGKDINAIMGDLNKLFPNTPPGDTEESAVRLVFGFSRVHKSLGWIKV